MRQEALGSAREKEHQLWERYGRSDCDNDAVGGLHVARLRGPERSLRGPARISRKVREPRARARCTEDGCVRSLEGMQDFRAGTSMPAIAENLCQRCGAQTEAVMLRGRASVEPCPCGGMRQVVRIARHRSGEPAASPERVERSVRHRSDEETTSASSPAPKPSRDSRTRSVLRSRQTLCSRPMPY
jgi:hypothetical protein